MQLLLYTTTVTPRLQYICHIIFKEILGVNFLITTSGEEFENNNGIKINYGNAPIEEDCFTIGANKLLFETNIIEQDIECFEVNNYKAFYKTLDTDFPFDIFAASFFLISRYEEYLPHTKDIYGRYAHQNSLAFTAHFLQLPLINIWADDLAASLQSKFPGFKTDKKPFRFLPTYDIDMAFSYKHKGWLRNIGGFVRSPSLKRLSVLCDLQKDPYDSFEWLNQLHEQYHLQPLYFFLLAQKNGQYDKNILPHKKAMFNLINMHAKKYRIGIHPSWQSGDNITWNKIEKERLQNLSGQIITASRQHYIRFNLPTGYRLLLQNGITDDHSMGYGSINGFRASVATSFNWFDLEHNETTELRIHPFCFMDANAYYEQKYTAAEAYAELIQYYSICKKVNGQLITVYHNNFLGTLKTMESWKLHYKKFVEEIEGGL